MCSYQSQQLAYKSGIAENKPATVREHTQICGYMLNSVKAKIAGVVYQ
jgi:hypothetical protein